MMHLSCKNKNKNESKIKKPASHFRFPISAFAESDKKNTKYKKTKSTNL